MSTQLDNPNTPVQRLRLRYGKKNDARFIGHLDVARFWERVFRRVDLPIAYSQGFNPQARLQFASALPVGIAGENELVDVWLLERIEPSDWLERLRSTLPPGFILQDICEVPLRSSVMQSSLRYAIYRVYPRSDLSQDELIGRVQNLLAEEEILRPHQKKKEKTYDLRPLVDSLDVQTENGVVVLEMKLRSGQQGNARASEVLEVLGLKDQQVTISRTELLLEEDKIVADTVNRDR